MSYQLNRGPKIVAALLGALGLFGGLRYAVNHGLLSAPSQESSVPARAALPELREAAPISAVELPVQLPGSTPGCTDKPELRALIWAWNAQMGWLYANG